MVEGRAADVCAVAVFLMLSALGGLQTVKGTGAPWGPGELPAESVLQGSLGEKGDSHHPKGQDSAATLSHTALGGPPPAQTPPNCEERAANSNRGGVTQSTHTEARQESKTSQGNGGQRGSSRPHQYPASLSRPQGLPAPAGWPPCLQEDRSHHPALQLSRPSVRPWPTAPPTGGWVTRSEKPRGPQLRCVPMGGEQPLFTHRPHHCSLITGRTQVGTGTGGSEAGLGVSRAMAPLQGLHQGPPGH